MAAAGPAVGALAHLDGGQQTIWAELGHALEATEKILKDSKLPARKKAVEQTKQLAVSTEGRLERWGGTAMQCVDVGPWLRGEKFHSVFASANMGTLLMNEYIVYHTCQAYPEYVVSFELR